MNNQLSIVFGKIKKKTLEISSSKWNKVLSLAIISLSHNWKNCHIIFLWNEVIE